MKRVILMLFVFAVAATTAQAQLSGGVRLGANVSGYQTENAEGSVKFGPTIGAFAQVKVWKIAIQPEVNYSQQGVNGNISKEAFFNKELLGEQLYNAFSAQAEEMALFAGETESTDKLHYLQVPVMVKFFPIAGLNIQVGPQFSYLVSSKRQFTDEFVADAQKVNEIYNQASAAYPGAGIPSNPVDVVQEGTLQNFKNSDISLNVGVGLDIWKLDIAARANIGLNDLRANTSAEDIQAAIENPLLAVQNKTKNLNFQFSVGYKIF